MKEFCICCAVKATDGTIIRGHRHADCFHSIVRRKKEISKAWEDQGFITSKNRYVDREEGFLLHKKAKIKSVNPEGYRPGWLFSEDLY
jgi:hypothetical protein